MKQRILLLISLALVGTIAYATEFKFGYVDVGKIFTTSKPAVAMQVALKVKFAPEQTQLQKMNSNLVSEQTQMQTIMKKAPSIDKLQSADRSNLEKLEATYQKEQMAFQQQYGTFQQTLQRAQDFASSAVLSKVNTILKDISDKGSYDLVITSNQMVYAKPKYDLTDQLIDQLNKINTTELIKQLDNVDKSVVTNTKDQATNSKAIVALPTK